MLAKFVIALSALGILAALAVSDARTLDSDRPATAQATEQADVLASVSTHAGARPLGSTRNAGQAAAAVPVSADAPADANEPKNWVLVAAGVYLIGTVLRRRARSTTI